MPCGQTILAQSGYYSTIAAPAAVAVAQPCTQKVTVAAPSLAVPLGCLGVSVSPDAQVQEVSSPCVQVAEPAVLAAAPVAEYVAAAPAATVVAAAGPYAEYVAAAPAATVVAAAAPAVVAAAPAAVVAAAPAELPLPALPPVNAGCWAPPPVAPGVNTANVVQLPDEVRVVETQDADVQTVVRENNNHTTFNKTVVTQVNRNHLHTQRIVTNENQFNTYVTNNVVKVNDIHRQRVEAVAGERRVFNDFKQTQVVEPARCLRAADGTLVNCQ